MREVQYSEEELKDAEAIMSVMYNNHIMAIISILDTMCKYGYSINEEAHNFNISL